MRVLDVIAAKRDGHQLADDDICQLVTGYLRGAVPDYQMSAFLMAVFIRGLSLAETTALTRAMVQSGATLDLSAVAGVKVDKHSTGGVGDKTTLILAPMLAACGLKVPKMSGRALGFTGGTIDKLESIPGVSTALSPDQIVSQLNSVGAVIASQSADIVPADKKIYALRDVTATVESIPLIAASVMSKKIACSSGTILLDVKTGSGAFAKSRSKALELARTMTAIGATFGRQVAAVITDMNQPLGNAVGNALEVAEAVEVLRGGGPSDLRELCVHLSAIILNMAEPGGSPEEGRQRAEDALRDGTALRKLKEIVAAQGGNAAVIDDLGRLPQAEVMEDVPSGAAGIVSRIDCARIGIASSILGAGRQIKTDTIDPAVGVVVRKKIGERVEIGESLAVLHANRVETIAPAAQEIRGAYRLGPRAKVPPLVCEVLR